MAAYNSCRNQLQESSAWFVLHEAGSLCLALLQQGRWVSVRSLRAGGDWRDSLQILLEREVYLIEQAAAAIDVFLWSPGLDKDTLPESGRWKFMNCSQRSAPILCRSTTDALPLRWEGDQMTSLWLDYQQTSLRSGQVEHYSR